jgi:hypothetical protein
LWKRKSCTCKCASPHPTPVALTTTTTTNNQTHSNESTPQSIDSESNSLMSHDWLNGWRTNPEDVLCCGWVEKTTHHPQHTSSRLSFTHSFIHCTGWLEIAVVMTWPVDAFGWVWLFVSFACVVFIKQWSYPVHCYPSHPIPTKARQLLSIPTHHLPTTSMHHHACMRI